ncbi:MAG: 4-(cytidine 5'-diphospho)-2-C-methyl-D-erythritol kinase [Candidatus Rokubacteria bacterium 13_1_40CM_69_27]|nr:MAG: 4-(cytidine 5'-diphospho)-2-C-methyl-D-erythritol kinase [Candidatus Rokubacteria bacterium 13_1_40CM_69_27]OLC35588.1 MAG: 4-(cytidine 5'-diphospho)-2-C-methyl-D-erythritol kinase [Candidatus Rokubacteria bacterium 13_1_40CM_4_69_5]
MLSAAAKVNLALEVLSKRADGYHEIATVMQTVDLSDRLILEDAETLELRVSAPGVPTDSTNLAVRAALALREAAGVTRGTRITLDKRIPVAGGLGGGSADAAAVLLGLNRLWGLRWSLPRLANLAVTLGMDVPFFLRGGTALATSRGETLEPVAGGALALVLVNPGFGSSTADVYRRVTPEMHTDGKRTQALLDALRGRRAARVAASLYNGLEGIMARLHPEIGRMEAALLAAGALGVTMSGSGPTVLGVARSFEHARQIRARLTRASWACWAVRTTRGPAVRVRATEAVRAAGRRRAAGRAAGQPGAGAPAPEASEPGESRPSEAS